MNNFKPTDGLNHQQWDRRIQVYISKWFNERYCIYSRRPFERSPVIREVDLPGFLSETSWGWPPEAFLYDKYIANTTAFFSELVPWYVSRIVELLDGSMAWATQMAWNSECWIESHTFWDLHRLLFPRTWNIHLFESHICTHILFCTCVHLIRVMHKVCHDTTLYDMT